LVGKPEGRDHSEDLNYDGNLSEIRWEFLDWIELTLGRDQWRDLVNTVLKAGNMTS
jgi:hypothetical protein